MNYRWSFWCLLVGYIIFYVPYGINETDGGFITGIAWQLLQGKKLYVDALYVRPPVPVFSRALELYLLPDSWEIRWERAFFYIKIAISAWAGAAILSRQSEKWLVACFAFVIGAHCYPACAWHTVDGILYAVLSVFCLEKFKNPAWGLCCSAFFAALAVFCKQSFFPLPVAMVAYLLISSGKWRALKWLFIWALWTALGLLGLQWMGVLPAFGESVLGAAQGGEAFQHGLFDYFRIDWKILAGLLLLSVPLIWRRQWPPATKAVFVAVLVFMALSYAASIAVRKDFTLPFAAIRLAFLFGIAVVFWDVWFDRDKRPESFALLLLFAISWMSAISWGYNLPILFAVPYVQAAFSVGKKLEVPRVWGYVYLWLLVLVFRFGYTYVYRDGPRWNMNNDLGVIFPKLDGIQSSAEKAALYGEFKRFTAEIGHNFAVLPAFPLANYLTDTEPVLPLNWVVNREMNGRNSAIYRILASKKPMILVQNEFIARAAADPELEITQWVLQRGEKVRSGQYFTIYSLQNAR